MQPPAFDTHQPTDFEGIIKAEYWRAMEKYQKMYEVRNIRKTTKQSHTEDDQVLEVSWTHTTPDIL